MKRVLLVLALVLPTASCKFNPGCLIEERVVTGLSNAVVNGLQCKNVDAVKEDIGAAVGKIGLCKKTDPAQTGPIAMIVCPIISAWAVNKLAQKIPPRWECSAEDAKAKIISVLTAGCNAIPF
jgi:hypothetical protein